MNILEAYIQEYGALNIVFSSIDYELLKEVVYNIAQDFSADFVDIYPIMINTEDIDQDRMKELLTMQNPIKFFITPVFPIKYVKGRFDYHINLSLNNTLITKKNIKQDLVNLELKYKDNSMINKYINIIKFPENKKLEDELFNVIIKRIEKKLDKGTYSDSKQNIKQNIVKKKDYKEKYISKEIDHDEKENYIEMQNNKIDNEIFNSMDDSFSNIYSELEDSDLSYDDISLDEYFYSSKDLTDKVDQKGGYSSLTGERYLKKNIIFGNRTIIKKMKKKYA